MNKKKLFSRAKSAITLGLLGLLALAALSGCSQPQQAPMPVIDESTGEVKQALSTITVNGEGVLSLTPDMASIELGVEVRDALSAKAAIEDNAKAMAAVTTALEGFAIKSEDIQTSNFSLNAYYDYDSNGNRIGKPKYTVTSMLSVTVYDIGKLGSILDAAVEAGANTTYGISFDVSEKASKETEALVLALENARARADALAAAAGKRVGEVVLLTDGTQISEPTPYTAYRSEAAAMDTAGVYKTGIAAGSMKVTGTVSVRFTLV